VQLNELTRLIIGSAIKVHCHLGPGVLEKSYELCMAHELAKAGRRSGDKLLYRWFMTECSLITGIAWTCSLTIL
jgi:GxxExxY protein